MGLADFLSGSKRAATYDGKMVGIPYRVTTGITHYQRALLEQAGISKLPETFNEFEKAAIATNKPPERYGFGISGRQGPAILSSFMPWLYSCGGDVLDFQSGEILINKRTPSPRWISGSGSSARTRSCHPRR